MRTILSAVLWLSPTVVMAAVPMPKCHEHGGQKELQVSNEAVIQYKKTMPNLKKIQVLVKAKFVKMLDTTENKYGKHQHFIVSLRDDLNDLAAHIEVSHSMNGYNSPMEADLKAGPVYLCGEYSTTDAQGYPPIKKFKPSDTGAMIHWTHQATRTFDMPSTSHAHGWIYVNGKVFGRYSPESIDPKFEH